MKKERCDGERQRGRYEIGDGREKMRDKLEEAGERGMKKES